jgi:hypothetical protein
MTARLWFLAILRASLLTIATVLVVFSIAGLALGASTAHNQYPVPFWQYPGPWVDWHTYVNAFDRMAGGAGIYAPEQLTGPYELTHTVLIGYAYPPASVLLFAPFLSYPFGLVAWLTLNLGLLLTAMWALISRAWPTHRAVVFAVALGGLAFYDPFRDGMISANVNVGIAGLIGWIAYGLRPGAAGILGSLGAIVKVFSGVVTLATPVQKRRSIVIAAVATVAVGVITLPIVGAQSWVDFVRALSSAQPDCSGFNISIACELAPSIGSGAGSLVGIAVGALAALALLAVREPFWMACLAAVAVMAPANNLHLSYWTIAYVLMVAAFAEVERLRRSRLAVAPNRRDSDLALLANRSM